jgi:molybdopterin-biosynthesis enzyme MoeA-like protein
MTSPNFGLIVIGDEILSQKRQDKHFEALACRLKDRQHALSWVHYLRDGLDGLTRLLTQTRASGDIVFSCGGIGNTPDDRTRLAASLAFDSPLCLHPEGYEQLKRRFPDAADLTPIREQLVHFPAGSRIIPNPFNHIPGFSIETHYFMPGFPQMAHPMMDWVLDTHYPSDAARATLESSLILTGSNANESQLIDLMQQMEQNYHDVRLFSLPSYDGPLGKHIELGMEGPSTTLAIAMPAMIALLEKQQVTWAWREGTHRP